MSSLNAYNDEDYYEMLIRTTAKTATKTPDDDDNGDDGDDEDGDDEDGDKGLFCHICSPIA